MYLLYIYLTKRDRAHTELCRRRLRPQSHAPLPSSLSLVTICTWAIDAWAMSAWAGIASAATRGHSVPVWGHSLSPEGQLCNCSVALPTFTTAERPCLLCRCTEAEAVLWEHRCAPRGSVSWWGGAHYPRRDCFLWVLRMVRVGREAAPSPCGQLAGKKPWRVHLLRSGRSVSTGRRKALQQAGDSDRPDRAVMVAPLCVSPMLGKVPGARSELLETSFWLVLKLAVP